MTNLPSKEDLAFYLQHVEFDTNELVMLKGKKKQILSLEAGLKLAAAIIKLYKERLNI